MKRVKSIVSLVFLSLLMFSGTIAVAQENSLPPLENDAKAALLASPRHGEWVTIKSSDGDSFRAWVVYPERSDNAPVVLVVHEIFGLTDWIRSVADSLAAEGFIAVAPDFLSGPDQLGSAAIDPDDARALIMGLPMDEVSSRLNAAADYATALPAARKEYGVVGFCWGGGVSFDFATRDAELGASVVYYGTSPETSSLANVNAPVLGLYGGDDARVNNTVPAAKSEMDSLDKPYEVVTYPGAGHAFLRNRTDRNGANQAAAEKAWSATIEFLNETLKD